MKTLRIVGALFWLGCGWCAGDAACRNARRHLEALEELSGARAFRLCPRRPG